jgi:hypothetical protein
MEKTKKDFDCVEMKHAGARRIQDELRDKSHEERMQYWRQTSDEIRRRYPEMRWLDDDDTVDTLRNAGNG